MPSRTSLLFTCMFVGGVLCAAPQGLRGDDEVLKRMESPAPELEQFFEKEVRPLLIAKCIGCHGEKDQKGDVRLDSAAALIADAAGGHIVVPEKPEESRLVDVIKYDENDVQMPPDNKLTDAQIETLTKWVKAGAPFPAKSGGMSGLNPASDDGVAAFQQTHWAFQPITNPTPPKVKRINWPKTDIDRFILADLENSRLSPSPPADRKTLLRRLSFDLTGLSPTYEEVVAFEQDKSRQAVEKVIDRLLASPQYGERWGRHWLDVARYSDTKGYVFTEDRRYPFSYTYRDYVIDAFNNDLPFDRFVMEQLAADQLDLGDNKKPLAAMGFLTLGRRFSNNIHDIIDDRIDVVSRGLQGLTVTCARCHDHKFDPIGMQDYYGLYGVFASSVEPGDLPMIAPPQENEAYKKYEAELNRLEGIWKEFRDRQVGELQKKFREQTELYLMAAWKRDEAKEAGEKSRSQSDSDLKPQLVKRWMDHLNNENSADKGCFVAWKEFEKLPAENFAGKEAEVIERLKALPNGTEAERINAVIQQNFVEKPPRNMEEVVTRYGKLIHEADKKWHALLQEREGKETPVHLDDPGWEEVRQVIYRENGPVDLKTDFAEKLLDRDIKNKVANLKKEVDNLRATSPAAPPRAMVLNDAPNPTEPKIFERGNPGRPGEQVPRRFFRVVSFEERDRKYTNGSGRMDLALGIVNPKNPLTARVLVNRIWLHHFGRGIVETASDFGSRGAPPTNPALLDHLASTFMQEGWSLKKLHKRILLSGVYQQSSLPRPEGLEIDPENKLLWRMNPQRLEFEPMRDSWMQVCGALDLTMGGRGVEIQETTLPGRRTVYAFIDRQDLPGLFRVFDFASPDVSTPQRPQTTIPQQALFGMNGPFAIDLSKRLAKSIEETNSDPQERIRDLYRRVYARMPKDEELQLALAFIEQPATSTPDESLAGPWKYGYGEYNADSKQVTEFHEFPNFNGDRWAGGATIPDEKIGWVNLSAVGGHPGQGPGRMAIRRWISPIDGEVEVLGELAHKADAGDGVRGRLISSAAGEVAAWQARHGTTETKVAHLTLKKGETIDFVVDCVGDQNHDSFEWAPVIRLVSNAGDSTSGMHVWNARNDFGGPAAPELTPWEQLAQILLISNEFLFVD